MSFPANFKLLSCFLCLIFSSALHASKTPSPHDLFSGIKNPSHQGKKLIQRENLNSPDWASWDGDEIVLKISRQALGKTFLFGINCTAGDHCMDAFAATSSQRVKFEKREQKVFILPEEHSHAVALDPITRWDIVKTDEENLYVEPHFNAPLNFKYFSVQEVLEKDSEAEVFDRFFHDTRSHKKGGIWFHETIRYQYLDYPSAFSEGKEKPSEKTFGATTFTHYILPVTQLSKGFEPKVASENFGYFINAMSFASEENFIYKESGEEFNKKNLKATRWNQDREIEWVVQRSVPTEIYQLIEKGIMNWTPHLPQTMSLKVRRARKGEELDSPYINPFIYSVNNESVGGVGNASYDIRTGEIIRGGITIFGPEKIPEETQKSSVSKNPSAQTHTTMSYGNLSMTKTCDMGLSRIEDKTRDQVTRELIGVVSHEVGHTLGLRHNFLGHAYTQQPEDLPGGSSVMDYPDGGEKLRIGPYDTEAIKWGYSDQTPSEEYLFCTDEKAGLSGFFFNLNPDCRRRAPLSSDLFTKEYEKLHNFLHVVLPEKSGELEDEDYDVLRLSLNLSGYFMRSTSGEYYSRDKANKAKELILRKLEMMKAPEKFGLEDDHIFDYKSMNQVQSLFDTISQIKDSASFSPVSFLSNYDLYNSHEELIKEYFEVVAKSDSTYVKQRIGENVAKWMDQDPEGFYLGTLFIEELRKVANTTSYSMLKIENEMIISQMSK